MPRTCDALGGCPQERSLRDVNRHRTGIASSGTSIATAPAKERLRKEMRTLREGMDPAEATRRSAHACARLAQLPELKQARRVLIYVPTRGEVDTRPLISALRGEGKTLFLPYVEGETLRVARICGLDDTMPGKYGVREPARKEPARGQDMDLAVVPGLAFDKELHRLGYGKGHYDRLLPSLSCPKVGLAYAAQLVESVPHEEHDVRMDLLVTDEEVLA